ncbi:MAG: hypothetical protein SVX43_09755 [Cyanobacteriota bacterium]|nr:hypothetical protein [Cyanobacteriota bacterium]
MMNAKAPQFQALAAENIESEIERMRQLAQSSSASAKLLQKLSASQDRLVRQSVAANPNTPAKILFELGMEFPEQLLDNPVFSLLPLEYPNLVEALPVMTLLRLLECDNFTKVRPR